MLITGVSPPNAYNREWRRSEPGTSAAPHRKPFRFSTIDIILDLSADAIRQTGRHEAAPARQQQSPPDTYTNSGTLAYHNAPDPADPTRFPPEEAIDSARAAAPRARNTRVTFDGMLRAPLSEDIQSPADL